MIRIHVHSHLFTHNAAELLPAAWLRSARLLPIMACWAVHASHFIVAVQPALARRMHGAACTCVHLARAADSCLVPVAVAGGVAG